MTAKTRRRKGLRRVKVTPSARFQMEVFNRMQIDIQAAEPPVSL